MMSEIFQGLPRLPTKTAVEPDRYDVEQLLEYLIPDDFLVFVNRQSKPDDAPDEETLTLAEIKRNMIQKKEIDE